MTSDEQKLLIFTNSARVWRSNTRGDYWVLDLKPAAHCVNSAAPSKAFDADVCEVLARRISASAYVRENNIYVEDLTGDFKITKLTTDGSRYIVNGTFDWVYEEELFCRDGFRWSPDSKQIAYWQLNSEGVKEMTLINNTSSSVSRHYHLSLIRKPVRRIRRRASASSAPAAARRRWFEVPGDARNNYLPRMEWAANSDEVIIQQLNRRQNTNTVMLGDARTGKVRTVLAEKDEAWVDTAWGDIDWDKTGIARGDVEWIDGGKRFLWASERDGWRHIYSISRDGSDVKLITPGNYDVISVERVDDVKWLDLFSRVARQRHAALSLSHRLDGAGKEQRLTPSNVPGFSLVQHFAARRFRDSLLFKLQQSAGDGSRAAAGTRIARTLIDNRELQDSRGPS